MQFAESWVHRETSECGVKPACAHSTDNLHAPHELCVYNDKRKKMRYYTVNTPKQPAYMWM